MIKCFISYRSLDSAKVDDIVVQLRNLTYANGASRYAIWQDKTHIPAGHDWWRSIVQGIIDCDVFIFMISEESVSNINCRAELSYAYKRNRPIIPVVLHNEFNRNPVTRKNDISYWSKVPDELGDNRLQFHFQETSSFIQHLDEYIQHAKNLNRRDIPADFPPDPRHANDDTNDTALIYDRACDYAWRMEFDTAEQLFQKLMNWNDPIFGEDSHEWILLIRNYKRIIQFEQHESMRYKVSDLWSTYAKQFPKPFTRLFDPCNLAASYRAIEDKSKTTPSRATSIFTNNQQNSSLNMESLFDSIFNLKNTEQNINLSLHEAFTGTERKLTKDNRIITVRIPAGVDNGTKIRVSGLGNIGIDGKAGDLFLVTWITAHEHFDRDGLDLLSTEYITKKMAREGGSIRIRTMEEEVTLKIPPSTKLGKIFRLSGFGMPNLKNKDERGNLLITVKISDQLIPRSIAIETLGGVATKIINSRTVYPIQYTTTFSTADDNQTQVEISLSYGDNSIAKDNIQLGRFILDKIPPAPRAIPQIDVTVKVDKDMVLYMSAQDKSSGYKKEFHSIDLKQYE